MLQQKLIKGFTQSKGRNNQGKITVQHRGGGHKKKYRLIDFKYNFTKSKIIAIEYDPNRNTKIFKILTIPNNTYKYVLAIENIKINAIIETNNNIKIGNILPLKDIPLGSIISNVEKYPNKGSQYIRSAGTFGLLIKRDNKYATVKLPSSQHRKFYLDCRAVLGRILNKQTTNLLKAGSSRWLGRRPHVRGVAMNPVDHPHGGGEGKTSGGRPSTNRKGVYTKGIKTRKKKNKTNIYIH